jgi:hypothetical protein
MPASQTIVRMFVVAFEISLLFTFDLISLLQLSSSLEDCCEKLL